MKPLQIEPTFIFPSHSLNAYNLSFSPDGKLLATGMMQNQGILLTDVTTGKVVRTLPEATFPVASIVFTRDGKHVLGNLFAQRPLCFWEVATGKLKWSLAKAGIDSVFSPDEKMLATTQGKSVLLVETASGKVLHTFTGHTSRVDKVDFSADGTRVVSVSGATVWLWDVTSHKPVRLVQEKKKQVVAAVFSPSGKWLGVTSHDGGVRLYDGHSGELVREFAGHDDLAWDLVFADKERRIITVGWDSRARCWDVTEGKEIWAVDWSVSRYTHYLALSPGEQFVAVAVGDPVCEVHLLDVGAGSLLARLCTTKDPAAPEQMSISPKGDWLAAISNDDQTRVWSLKGIKA